MTAVPTTGAGTSHSPTPGPSIPEPATRERGLAGASGRLLRNTPGRFTIALVVMLSFISVFGIAAITDTSSRSISIDEASGQQGRMAIAAFDMYRSLSDADAAITATFLPGQSERADLNKDYQTGVRSASTAVTTLSAQAANKKQADLVAELSAAMPIYTGLVETARSYHRQGLPLGLAYLRDASALAQEDMLPKLKKLQSTSMSELGGAKDDAAGFPWIATVLGVGALAMLGYTQWRVAKRTNRVLNIGMATATVLMLVMGGWSVVSWVNAAGHIETGHDSGTQPLSLLSQAHIDVQRARSDEALTLIAQGGNVDYEAEYKDIMKRLLGENGTLAQLDKSYDDARLSEYVDKARTAAEEWNDAHKTLREADDKGDFATAVESATGDEDGQAGKAFNALDDVLTSANARAAEHFTRETEAAGNALYLTVPGFAVLTVVAMIAAAAGIQRRISEYR